MRTAGSQADPDAQHFPGHPLHRPCNRFGMGQQQFPRVGRHDLEGMVEAGCLPLLSPFTSIGQKIVAGNGEQPGHGNRVEVGMQFLSDSPFVPAMEGIDTDGRPGDFVQFPGGPAPVVEVADVPAMVFP